MTTPQDSALIKAITAQNMDDVKSALAAGASPDAVDENGIPALQAALALGNKIIPHIILSAGANPVLPDRQYDALLLRDAVSFGITHAYDKLHAAGVPIETQENDDTLLYKAVFMGQTAIAKRLLADGANVNAQGMSGSALRGAMGAITTGDNEDCVILLLEAGADTTAESYDHNHGGVVSDLESAQSRAPVIRGMVNAAAKGAETLRQFEIFRAIEEQNTPRLHELLARGSTADVMDENGNTALIRAVIEGYEDGVSALIAAGADTTLGGAGGVTPLHAAAAGNNAAIAEALVATGATARAKDDAGFTPLQYAERTGNAFVHGVIRAQYDGEIKAMVDKTMQVSEPVKISPVLKVKPRGKVI